jgi:feruloyl esterase
MAACGVTGTTIAATCESLATLSLPDTTITVAQTVPAGTFTIPGGPTLAGLPASCRVTGVIHPTSDSHIIFEVWLPAANWNSKLQQVGNGGLAGVLDIFYATVPSALQRGYVVAGTDDGHQASPLDGSWAIGHPEKVKDFGYRAVHLTNQNAKAITQAFYSHAPKFSYFNACSEGGREAHMEVQRYPDDFDGLLVGSPAHFWTDLMVRFQWDQHALLNTPGGYIPTSKLPAIQAAALTACDAIDGLSDGLVNDPRACMWNPSAIQCTGADNNSCLTAPQVGALNKIYAGPTNPRTGEQISTGYERSGENSGNWVSYIIGPAPGFAAQQLFSVSFYSGFVFENPAWDFRTFDFDHDVAYTRTKLADILDATDPDISAFQQRGGKLIQYHGWIDASPHPRGSIEYYEDVVSAQSPGKGNGIGERKVGLRRTQDFYRLFLAPGMEHCVGGPGPNVFGQVLAAPPPSHDAQHDALTALEQWVENGTAPEKIIATKYVNDNPALGIQLQRPLCPYPQTARWNATGSTSDASSFTCVDEKGK